MTALATNPADAYRTWIMGVRRTLQRTGYPEAAKHVGDYDRDLRGVYLSGGAPTEGAGLVSRRWTGGYNENARKAMQENQLSANVAYGGSGVLIGLSAAAVGGLILYFLLKPSPAAATTGGGPSMRATPSTPTAAECPLDLTKLEQWAKQHPTVQIVVTGTAKPPAFPPASATGKTTVAITTDGNFWTYAVAPIGAPTVQRRDDLRDSYCKSLGTTALDPAAMFVP